MTRATPHISTPRTPRRGCRPRFGMAATLACLSLMFASSAAAQEELCDNSFQDCRAKIKTLIENEQVGIDVSFWFMQAPESTEVDFSRVPHILGVPRYFYRKAPREVRRWVTSAFRGDAVESFDAELWLWFFAGVLKQRWTDRKLPRPPAARRVDPEPAMSR